LLLNLYYPPDTSATAKMAAGVVNALAAKHEVTVLCGRPSYDPTERRPWRSWQTERAGNVSIIRVGSTDYSRERMAQRLLNYLTYVALSMIGALCMGSDIVLGMTDPPFEGIVASLVAMLKRKPYIYNIRDLYPEMALGGSIIRPGIAARIWEKLHRWALCRASRVIVLGADMRQRIVDKGIQPQRVTIVRDGADIPPVGSPRPALDSNVIRAIRGNFQFVLLHAGNLGFYGAWDTLLASARELARENIGLVFVGDGAQRPRLQAAAKQLANVRFLPFFPGDKIPSVLAAADAHIVTIKRGLEGVVAPSKMYGILAAGKPILALAPAETDVAQVAGEAGCGISVDPDRPEDLSRAIRALAADSQRIRDMGEAAQRIAPRYDRVNELRKFVEIVEGSHGP
jgi:putative colanic acid biosynthesis glycosyltransferase WcaI